MHTAGIERYAPITEPDLKVQHHASYEEAASSSTAHKGHHQPLQGSPCPHSQVVGDLVPQSVCVRHGLLIGAHLSWLLRLALWVTSPVSWPLAKLLDLLVGKEHHSVYKHQRHAVGPAYMCVHESRSWPGLAGGQGASQCV